MPLLSRLGLAWIVGIALADWLNLPWPVIAIASLPPLGALLLDRQTALVRWLAILALSFLAGAFRLILSQPVFDENFIAFYNDSATPVTVTGLVVDEPDVRDTYINLRLQTESLQLKDAVQPISGLLLVRAPRYPERFYGDRVAVTGKLETPPVFEDFSYKDYLASSGIYSLVRRPRIELIESNGGNPFWIALFAFKTRASHTINRFLAEPHASLLNGILLGIQTGIPKGVYQAFNLTGASHIIVISGSNISIITGIFLLLGQRLAGKRYAPPIAISGIIIYTLLVGADAAVSRAAVMGIVFVLAI